jgi:TonB-linked SusC/RagA family outer membrane protein
MSTVKSWKWLTLIILSLPNFAFGQLTIEGKVTDNRGEALVGANVFVIGTNRGAATDVNGSYKILLTVSPAGETIVEARFIGYKTARQTLTQTSGIATTDFALKPDALQLDEVVVTGTSVATTKRQLGNAISTVAVRELSSSGATAVDAALAGKLSGALITQNSGNPAGGITVRLRGTSTVLGSADPLYIVDGVIVSNDSPQLIDLGGYRQNRLVDLNPNDIDRIEVIKGAAAAAIYGSRANNGVVQIFTRRGNVGAPQITLSTRLTSSAVRKTLEVNKFPFDKPESDATKKAVTRYDYQDFIFQRAYGVENNASVTGGSGATQYYFSGSYLGNEGIIRESSYKRMGGRARLDQTLADWARVSVGANYTYSQSHEIPNGGINEAYGALTGMIFSPNTVDPRRNPQTGLYPNTASINRTNPVEAIERFDFRQQTSRFIGDLQFNMTPLKGLGIDYTLGYDTYDQSGTGFIPSGTSAALYPLGFARRGNRDFLQVNNDLNIRYQRNLFGDVQSTTVAGATLQYERSANFTAQSTQLSPVSQIVTAGAAQVLGEFRSTNVIYGAFAQETFGLWNRLFLTGAVRFDASSVFGEDDRWQFYPKASASYLISDENFWRNSSLAKIFPSFKLRGSWGESGGLTAIGPFDRFTNYNPFSYDGKAGLVPNSQLGTAEIKPERQRETEVGVDLGLWGDRIGVEFSYYNKHVDDLLLFRSLAPSTGFLTRLENVGTLDNKGFEILLRALVLQGGKLRWNTTLTYSENRNEVNGIEGGFLLLGDAFGQAAAYNGLPLGVFYTTFLARNPDGTPLLTTAGLPQAEQRSRAANGQPTGGTVRKVTGNPNPDFIASWINEFEFDRNFSLRAQFDAMYRFDVFNFTRRVGARGPLYGNLVDYERELRGEVPAGTTNALFGVLSEWIEDGSFIKLRELSLSYDMHPKIFGVRGLRLSLIGRNLFSIDDYSGYDPEINTAGQSTSVRGFDFVEVPIPRTYSFGLTVSY